MEKTVRIKHFFQAKTTTILSTKHSFKGYRCDSGINGRSLEIKTRSFLNKSKISPFLIRIDLPSVKDKCKLNVIIYIPL